MAHTKITADTLTSGHIYAARRLAMEGLDFASAAMISIADDLDQEHEAVSIARDYTVRYYNTHLSAVKS